MGKSNKIVVEVQINAPVALLWERTQDSDLHVLWDIRFSSIRRLEQTNDRGFQLLAYETRVGFGLRVAGHGSYMHNVEHRHSTFEFDSNDCKSLIRSGRGIWLYEPNDSGTFFKTVFDYEPRFGLFGQVIDWLLFRFLFQLATEWGFETLRLWCEGDQTAPNRRRSKFQFLRFVFSRLVGARPKPEMARSWQGTGKPDRPSCLNA